MTISEDDHKPRSLGEVAQELGADPTQIAANNFASCIHQAASRLEEHFGNYSVALNAAEAAVTQHPDDIPVNKEGYFKIGCVTRIILHEDPK